MNTYNQPTPPPAYSYEEEVADQERFLAWDKAVTAAELPKQLTEEQLLEDEQYDNEPHYGDWLF